MAAEEVIYFSFWAQLSPRPKSPAPSPPEQVAEPPPLVENIKEVCLSRPNFAIRVSRKHSQRSRKRPMTGEDRGRPSQEQQLEQQ
jgi:hypothetical protein